MWASVVATSSGLSCALRMMMVKAMMAVEMAGVGLVLLNLERGDIRGEREGDGRCRDGWSKRTGPQRLHAQQVYRNWTQS